MFGSLNKHMRVLWIISDSSLVVFSFFIIITIELCFLLVVRSCLHFFSFKAHYFWFDLSVHREICCCCILLLLLKYLFCSGKNVSAYSLLFCLSFSLFNFGLSAVVCNLYLERYRVAAYFVALSDQKKRNKKRIGWKNSNKTSSSISIGVRFLYTVVVDSTKKKEIKN